MRTARLAGAAVLGSGLLAVAWAGRPLGLDDDVASARPATASDVASRPRVARDSLVRAVVQGDVFRSGRQPAASAYDPQRASNQIANSAPAARPTLALVGFVDGEPPTAVIEGFPGTEGGRVVRQGDVVGAFTVRRVGKGEVRIAGMDSVWVLKVRLPWR